MKKIHLPIFLALSLALAATYGWYIFSEEKADRQFSQFENGTREIQINGEKFSAEIAATPEKKALGLSGRRELCSDCAMLFVFEKPDKFSFWMKDMMFDLDIIWILNGEIVDIDRSVSHERGSAEIVRSRFPADKVLEINAGTSDNLDLKVGGKVEF